MEPHERAAAGLFLGFQYPVEIPGVSYAPVPARGAQCAAPGARREGAFGRRVHPPRQGPGGGARHGRRMLKRPVNVGFSGGEKKRDEMVQMGIMTPRLAILDETDSGLDIDALKAVGAGINRIMRAPDKAVLLITHYQRLLDYVRPDRVHVLSRRPDHPLGRPRAGARTRARRLCRGRPHDRTPDPQAGSVSLRRCRRRWRRCGASLRRPNGSKLLRSKSCSKSGCRAPIRCRFAASRSRLKRAPSANIFALNTASTLRPHRDRRDACRRRAFRARRGQHRRRQFDARNRHHRAPHRRRRDLAPDGAQRARRQGDRLLSRQGRGRARRAADRQRAVGEGDAARPRRDRQLPSPSSKSTPTTSSARMAPPSASSTRSNSSTPPRAGSTRRAARALLLEGFVAGLWSDIDGDDQGIADLARAALKAIA